MTCAYEHGEHPSPHPRNVSQVVKNQLVRFLQSRGVDTRELLEDSNYLKKWLTGDPVWYLEGDTCLRVPLASRIRDGLTERPNDHID